MKAADTGVRPCGGLQKENEIRCERCLWTYLCDKLVNDLDVLKKARIARILVRAQLLLEKMKMLKLYHQENAKCA